MRKTILMMFIMALCTTVSAKSKMFSVTVANTLGIERRDMPVVIDIEDELSDDIQVATALVTCNGTEIPCQLDDFNQDGEYDELVFLADLKGKEKKVYTVTLSEEGAPREYKSRVYGAIALRDRAAKNQKHLPILSLTVPASSNSYQYVYPHGPLLESEYVGFRIYCDHRQSVDYYGHKNKQLELSETQFYPTKEQKSTTYGDDVLYTGSTYGCGTMHGWNGKTSVMFENVRSRTYTLAAAGPLRTIIETVNKGWKISPESKPVDVRTRYILYAGHRDVLVDVKFSRNVGDLSLSTGVTDIVGSESYSDKSGIRACWGRALAGNNPKVYDEHTVGLAVCIPKQYYKGDSHFTNGKEKNPDQAYVALLGSKSDRLHYWFSATCDIESFGFPDSKAWFSHLADWKEDVMNPVKISIAKGK